MYTRKYTAVPGFFLQDDPASRDDHAGAIPPRFGLKNDGDDRWIVFKREIERLNQNAPQGVQYKVIYLGRHGQGPHNLGVEKYSMKPEEWQSKWVRLNGDGELVWGPDPKLNELGVEQAKDVNRAWKAELEYNIPLPEKLYTSSLSRAIETNKISFEDVLRPDLKTTIVEIVRERTGVCTFNKRRKKSEIERDFPDYPFEERFTEEDECWNPDTRETPEELDARAVKALDMVFDNDEQFISITTHHVFIEAFLRVCNHRPWKLSTGGVIPIVLEAGLQL